MDDPRLIGRWEAIDFVRVPGDFSPYIQSFPGKIPNVELIFLPGGKSIDDQVNWTKDFILFKDEQTSPAYIIKEIGGKGYLFFEWKSGAYLYHGMTPKYYVLKKSDG